MSDYKSDFLRILSERGFIHQMSDVAGLDQEAAAGRQLFGDAKVAFGAHVAHGFIVL